MTLSERIARVQGAARPCLFCGRADNGRAWCDCGRPLVLTREPDKFPQSPFTRAALAGTLPAKVIR